jgi:Tfp pilus assembly protein PilN
MNNEPAFPVPSYVNADGETHDVSLKGMTLRDYFAAKAMQAMLSSPEFLVVVTADQAVGGNAKDRVSNVSFAYADAMLKAREA